MRCLRRFGYLGLWLWMGFFSLPIQAIPRDNTTVSAQATPLIQAYQQTHPVTSAAIKRLQNNVDGQLQQLTTVPEALIARYVQRHRPRQAVSLSIYPLRSVTLTPGPVAARAVAMHLPVPIFIAGDDLLSMTWLHRYGARLAELHAQGFVVNMKSRTAMQSLQMQFPHLSLHVLPGDMLATTLSLTHYPVLITDKRIEQ